jgi:hypothetical protein
MSATAHGRRDADGPHGAKYTTEAQEVAPGNTLLMGVVTAGSDLLLVENFR